MHVSVTVCFTDYAFNENIHNMYWFHKCDVLPDTPFFRTDTKIKEHVSFESWKKTKTFACVIFGKICYVAYAINRAGLHNWSHASLLEPDISLISLHLKARFNKTIIVFIMGAIVHSTSWSSIFHWRNFSKMNYKI